MTQPVHATLAEAFVAAQAAMPTSVKKDGVNPHFKSKYTTFDALVVATKPVLNQHGLGITQEPINHPENGLPILRTVLLHASSAETRQMDTPLFFGRNDMQGFGAAITYARRYAWASMLGIASEEDTDGEHPSQAAPAAEAGPKMASKQQKAKLGAQISQLMRDAAPLPGGYEGVENWVDVLKVRLAQEYGVESRNDLTQAQASELIDWFEAQAIPF